VLDDGEVDGDGEGEGEDHRKYCTCRNVSYGDMVACDNDECPYEWFHWQCVGMTREPGGEWFCGECKAKLGIKA
jgi:inhibitor of growth protein 3